jgi:hypothetical protein
MENIIGVLTEEDRIKTIEEIPEADKQMIADLIAWRERGIPGWWKIGVHSSLQGLK